MKVFRKRKNIILVEDDLLPENNKCKFCSSASLKNIICFNQDPEINLMECEDCFAVSASRIPKENIIKELYKNYYKNDHHNITMDLPEKFSKHIFNMMSKDILNNKSIKILDFGGGDGAISLKLAELFVKNGVENVEISLVDHIDNFNKTDFKDIKINKFYKLSDIQSTNFNVIIASAIIEHLEEPAYHLALLFSFLKKNGFIYFRSPYILPLYLFLKKFGLNLDLQYPTHLHDLGFKFWNNLKEWIKNVELDLIVSQPSFVQTSFKNSFLKTLIAYFFKLPWYIFKNKYKLVGGWEVLYRKKN
jgi:ubiquinone/menaquinone biosynthesis C-methylase UbiE